MICKNCGMANADTATICSECGSALPTAKAKAAHTTAADETQSIVAQEQQSASVEVGQSAPAREQSAAAEIPQAPPAAAPPVMQQPAAQVQYMPYTPLYGAPPVPPQNTAYAPYSGQPVPPMYGAYMPTAQNTASVEPAAPLTEPVNTAPPPPVYPNPYGQVPPYPGAFLPPDRHAKKANWALGLGITAAALPIITCSLASPLGLAAGIAALVLGAVSMHKVYPQNRGKAIAGLVTGIVGILISIFSIAMLWSSLSTLNNSDAFKDFYEQYSSFISLVIRSGLKVMMHTIKVVIGQLQMIMRFLLLK